MFDSTDQNPRPDYTCPSAIRHETTSFNFEEEKQRHEMENNLMLESYWITAKSPFLLNFKIAETYGVHGFPLDRGETDELDGTTSLNLRDSAKISSFFKRSLGK